MVAGEYHAREYSIEGSKKGLIFHDLLNCESFASRSQILIESMDSETAPFNILSFYVNHKIIKRKKGKRR